MKTYEVLTMTEGEWNRAMKGEGGFADGTLHTVKAENDREVKKLIRTMIKKSHHIYEVTEVK